MNSLPNRHTGFHTPGTVFRMLSRLPKCAVLLVLTCVLAGQPSRGQDEPATPSVAGQEPATVEVIAPLLPVPKPPAKPVEPAPPPSVPAAPDRWAVMQELQGTWPGWLLDSNRIQITGWADSSYTASTDRQNQLPMGFNFLANQFLLQQNWVRFERTVVTSGTSDPTFGFRTDWILPGSDYRFTLPRGIFNSQLTADHGDAALYGIDPIQFYLEGYIPTICKGLDLKVGRFFCIYGVETNDAVSNILASHAYTFIYDPFTHTGFLATLNASDTWIIQAGVGTGNDVFIDAADNPTFFGNFKWTRPDQRESVLFNVILDNGRFDQAREFHNPEVFDVVYYNKLTDRFYYTFEGLFGFTGNVPEIGTAYWASMIHYLTRDFTSRLSGTIRLELFDDLEGQRTGHKGLYTDLTTGVNFRLRKDIILRPEVRWDYNGESRPFEGNHGLFTATADLILRW